MQHRESAVGNGSGQVCRAGELAVQGRALFKVADIENLFLRVYVTADQLTRMTIGKQVAVFADDGTSDPA